MTQILGSGYTNGNLFYLDFLVEREEYTTLKEKVIDDLVAEVEVNGFRKGKAPREKALPMINGQLRGQKIVETVLETYSGKAGEEVNTLLKKDQRVISGLELDFNPEFTVETPEGGFKMRIKAHLLPSIDLSKVDSLKIKQPTQADIPDLPDFLEFKKVEMNKLMLEQNSYDPAGEGVELSTGLLAVVDMHGSLDGKEMEGLHSHGMQVVIGAASFLPTFEDNLVGLKKGDEKEFDLPFPENYTTELAGKTAQVKVKITDVLKQKYATIDELLEGKEELKKFYPTKDALEKDIENVYNARTEQVIENIRRKRVVEEVLKVVPDFELDQDLIDSETKRIYDSLVLDAQAKNVSLGNALIAAGISAKPQKELDKLDESGVKTEVSGYVRNEVKLTNILSLIYQTRVENKPTSEEFEVTVKEAMKDKQKYSIEDDATEDRVRNIINDRIIRQAAGGYLLDISKKNV